MKSVQRLNGSSSVKNSNTSDWKKEICNYFHFTLFSIFCQITESSWGPEIVKHHIKNIHISEINIVNISKGHIIVKMNLKSQPPYVTQI